MLHGINGLSDFFLNKKNEVVCNKKRNYVLENAGKTREWVT